MPTIKLGVIAKPSEHSGRSILDGVNPYFKGDGDVNHTCGKCDALLTQNVRDGQLRNLVLRCASCKAYNNLP